MLEEINNYVTQQNKIVEKAMAGKYEGAYENNELRVYSVGNSYTKICRKGSVHSFIAMKDINTKSIQCRKGDVLKAASWKAPANHARGSVFEPKTTENFNWTGPDYLV